MAVEIGDISLQSIHKVSTLESAGFINQPIAGFDGGIKQDYGRPAVRLQIEGIFYGKEAQNKLEELRKLYLKKEPAVFVADIIGQTYASKVLIEELEAVQSASYQEQFSFCIVISEYNEPPSKTSAINSVEDLTALDAAAMGDFMDSLEALSIGNLPELSNPVEPLEGSLNTVKDGVDEFMTSMNDIKSILI